MRLPSTVLLPVALLAIIAVMGVIATAWIRTGPERQRAAYLHQLEQDSARARAAVHPVIVKGVNRALSPFAVSVLVSKDAMWVDHAAWTRQHIDAMPIAPDAELSPIASIPVSDWQVDRSQRKGMLILPLFDHLLDMAERHKELRYAGPDQDFDGNIRLYLDKDTPHEVMSGVIYTAAQAQFSDFELEVQGGWIPLELPDNRRWTAMSYEGHTWLKAPKVATVLRLPDGPIDEVVPEAVSKAQPHIPHAKGLFLRPDPNATFEELVQLSTRLNGRASISALSSATGPPDEAIFEGSVHDWLIEHFAPAAAHIKHADQQARVQVHAPTTLDGSPLAQVDLWSEASTNTSPLSAYDIESCLLAPLAAHNDTSGRIVLTLFERSGRVRAHVSAGALPASAACLHALAMNALNSRDPRDEWRLFDPAPPSSSTVRISIDIDGGPTPPAPLPARLQHLYDRLQDGAIDADTADLVTIAMSDGDLLHRAHAIESIARTDAESLRPVMTAQPALVGLWAAAAWARHHPDSREVLRLSEQHGLPSAAMPIIRERLLNDRPRDATALLHLLDLGTDEGGDLAKTIDALPPEELVRQMLTASRANSRRRAAGLLARRPAETYVPALLKALDPATHRQPPWQGGALFLPSTTMQRPHAITLTEHLMRWWIRCEHDCADARPALLNNLGRRLLLPAGILCSGWEIRRQPQSLHRCLGPDRIRRLTALESR